MKRLFNILAAAALIAGLWACEEKPEPALDTVDLRYRCADSYDLDAVSAKAFTIVVKSTKPWTIKSEHPDWCIISVEAGEAVADSLVRIGQGENTSVRVQYYDNTQLDDRHDIITIASAGYVGKQVQINQKGIAYMDVPEASIEGGMFIEKAGGELTIEVKSNQDWSAKVTSGDSWLSIASGATGTKNGTIKLMAKENTGEKRYASVAVYDRHTELSYEIRITQDGVQLDPETQEVRVGYDQLSASIGVVSNAKWIAEKGGDDWFTIDNPDGHDGDDVLHLTITDNSVGTAMRKAVITLKTIAASPEDAVAVKEIVLKQAFPITPVRVVMDNDEMGSWASDWANPPVYTKDYGTLFVAKSRLNQGSMPFGTYTFRWKDLTVDPGAAEAIRVRHWFCYSESCEMKFDLRPVDGKISFDFNVAGDGNKPSLDAYTDVDWTQPIEITYKFDPSGAEHCHVTYLVNGKEAASFDTSENLLRTVTWGAKINMYIGVDKSGSAVLEWYEYTAPMNWDE